MNLKEYYIRTELAFWNKAIPAMRESRLMRSILRKIYTVWSWISSPKQINRRITWTTIGLTIGFIIGLISTILI